MSKPLTPAPMIAMCMKISTTFQVGLEFEKDQFKKWELEPFELNNINLFVGDNASGKSRTLKYIYQLSRILLSNRFSLNSGKYYVELFDESDDITCLQIDSCVSHAKRETDRPARRFACEIHIEA